MNDILEQHKTLIIKTLLLYNNSLILADLKTKTKLANMFFINAVDELEKNYIIERVKRGYETWIILKKRIRLK